MKKTSSTKASEIDYTDETWEVHGAGVAYVADAINQLEVAVVALDDAQASSVVVSCGTVDAIQPAVKAVREARNLLKCALEWHARPARRALKAV